jgi:uncharacterized protein YqhQ
MTRFNHRIRQVVLIAIIGLLIFLIVKELYIFVPGFLGAITTYILTRKIFFRLVEKEEMEFDVDCGPVFICCSSRNISSHLSDYSSDGTKS